MDKDNHSSSTLFGVYCFIIAVAVQPTFSAELFVQCVQDSDCDSDEYCSGNYCEICLPCEDLLNREPASGFAGRRCAKTEEECGSCLPGFQSEELTNQRRSYKCAPVEMKSEGVQEFKVLSWEPFLVGIICLMSLTFAAMATCYFTRRGRQRSASLTKNEETEELIVPSAPYLPRPPPYNPVDPGMSTVDEADSYRIMPRHEILDPSILTDVLHVGATPIGPYHRYCESVQPEPNMEDLIEDEEVNVAPVIEFNHAASHDSIPTEGSTETIPSQWEPESVVNVDMDESHSPAPGALLAPSNHLYRVRSQSFEHLPFFARPEHSPVNLRAMFAHSQRSQSDPEIRFNRGRRASFAGETYAHRHVRLSAHRSQNNQAGATEQEASPPDIHVEDSPEQETRIFESMSDVCGANEADIPLPFAYSDDERHSDEFPFRIILMAATLLNQVNPMREGSSMPSESPAGGSHDSGFFDDSRRRRVPNEEIEIGFAFYAKRSRHN